MFSGHSLTMSTVGIAARKAELRRSFVASILGMDPDQRRAEERTLLERVTDLPGFAGARNVLLYASAFPEEIRTIELLGHAKAVGKRVICPRVDRLAQRLILFEVPDPLTDLVPGMLRIPEPRHGLAEVTPSEIDWALIPGLGFDDLAYRLGRGRGHYDRLLPQLPPQAPRWAIALTPQGVAQLPVEPHDQPLSGVLFAHRIIHRA